LKTAILINISLTEFEYMTPYELMLHIEAFFEKQQAEMEEKVSLVWLREHYHRVKKLPSLKTILKDMQPNKGPMTNDEMLAMVKQLNAQFGGEIISAETKEGD
jgi:hypothetical protein